VDKASPILVTGTAGFIGFHLAWRLLRDGYTVVGIDNLNNYYDVNLKNDRNQILKGFSGYTFLKQELADQGSLKDAFNTYKFKHVVHLAAQAGVRYSLENPFAYVDSNITAFVNILERCKDHKVQHLVFASSSSVYGANTDFPFSESVSTEHPLSLYGATKKANEMLAHAYAVSHKLPVTGLRFFTAYGPWGRPDMALFLFTNAILKSEPIDVYNNGDMMRDFTFVEAAGRLIPCLQRSQ
jgi:UDP-glucuronate 4-epimerase